MIIDYELATGKSITHPKYGTKTPWNIKAEIMKALYKYLLRNYPKYPKVPITRKIGSLHPFTTRYYWGFSLRCKPLMGLQADKTVVINLLTFLSEGSAGSAQSNKPGALNHIIKYNYGYIPPVIRDPDLVRLQSIIQKLPKTKRRLTGKQRSPNT